MAVVKQIDKRSGITYVYGVTSFWDKEKQQSRSKRVLMGKLDSVTGDIIPSDDRGKHRSQFVSDTTAKRAIHTERLFYGATSRSGWLPE